MTTWSKTPPSEPGWYWARAQGMKLVTFHPLDHFLRPGIEFGPRIPSPDAISALEARLAAQEARIQAAKDALREAEDTIRAEGDLALAEKCRAALAKLDPDGTGEGAAT